MAQNSLSNRFLTGAAWLTATQVVSKVVATIRFWAIARLVPQADVGMFALALMVTQLVEVLGTTGISAALIQRSGEAKPYLGTAYTVQIVRGFVLGAILIALGPAFESYFEKPDLREVLVPMALISVLGGLRNVNILVCERDLNFAVPATIDVVRGVADLIVSVVVAWFWPTIWALVVGQLSTYVLGTALSYFMIPERTMPTFQWRQYAELSRFAIWVVVSTILAYFMVAGGQFVVAVYLSKDDIATYQVAYLLGCTPTAELCRVVARVAFPAFSTMQTQHSRAVSAFYRVSAFTSFWVVLVIGLATFAAPGLASLFPPGYAAVSTVLPWLAVWGASRALADVDASLLQAVGQPGKASMIQLVTFLGMFAATIPLCQVYGVHGVAWGLGGTAIGSQLVRTFILQRFLGVPWRDVVTGLAAPVGAALVAGIPSWAIMYYGSYGPNFVEAVGVSTLFGATYLVVCLGMDRLLGTMYLSHLWQLFRMRGSG